MRPGRTRNTARLPAARRHTAGVTATRLCMSWRGYGGADSRNAAISPKCLYYKEFRRIKMPFWLPLGEVFRDYKKAVFFYVPAYKKGVSWQRCGCAVSCNAGNIGKRIYFNVLCFKLSRFSVLVGTGISRAHVGASSRL